MKRLRLGLILCSARAAPLPSTRISVLNMVPLLGAAGIDCEVLFEPEQPSEMPSLSTLDVAAIAARCDIVLFQKVRGAQAVALAQTLRQAGVLTVSLICDRIEVAMTEATDATIVVTAYLKSLYPAQLAHRIHVVHDGIENPAACKQHWDTRPDGLLHGVLVSSDALDRLPVIGTPPPWTRLRLVGKYPRWHTCATLLTKQWKQQDPEHRLSWLRYWLDRRITRVAWGPNSVYRELAQADIGVLPIEPGARKWGDEHHQMWRRKSENRLTLKMAIGLPVIATPIPAYEALIEHGVNGMFASSRADWITCLDALRDPARRRAMGQAARTAVLEPYSMARQAQLMIAVLRRLQADAASTGR